jgi:hypothetical protein
MEEWEYNLPAIPSDTALQIAARCWCDTETGHCTMDADLAKAFAKRIDKLMLIARLHKIDSEEGSTK